MIGLAEFQISTLLSAASSRQSYSCRLEHAAFSDQKRSTMNTNVSHLLSCVDVIHRKLREDSVVTCLITDSRRVVPGALFFAIGGLRTDGNLYIEEAVDRGAVAIITEEDLGQINTTLRIYVSTSAASGACRRVTSAKRECVPCRRPLACDLRACIAGICA